MNYQTFFKSRLKQLKTEGNYRHFAELQRQVGRFPVALNHLDSGPQHITLWCSNDYLGMGHNPEVIDAMKNALDNYGAGAGGTRNISGTTHAHVKLEKELASWHHKPSALVFTSGYVANLSALSALGAGLEGCVFLSDSKNHNSMIAGMRYSRAKKLIFNHNDIDDLANKLAEIPKTTPKVVAFESVYSMDGDIAPVADIISLAKKHSALTYLDEVHAVGMYGQTGAGISERDGLVDDIDIIQGTLGKAVGIIGGYISASHEICDFVRSFGQGFIFTTSLPPAVAEGAQKSISILKQRNDLRISHQERAATLKAMLKARSIPLMPSISHIVPVHVGDTGLCKKACDMLLADFGIYVQPINYPTVEKGTERLRLTPTPLHDDKAMGYLVESLEAVWQRLDLPRNAIK